MKTLRYWYKAFPPQVKKRDLVPNGESVDVIREGKVVATVSKENAEKLSSWEMRAVVWEKKGP